MKDAIHYKNEYLAKNSFAYELYLHWQKTKDPKDQAKLDRHIKAVNQVYNEMRA